MASGSVTDTIFLTTPQARQRAHVLIDAAPEGYCMKLGEPTRTDLQNSRLHPMIADIQAQVPDMAIYNAKDARLRFLDALGAELRFLPKLEGAGLFPVGLSSATLSKSQFSGLLELLFKYGAENGVLWSDPTYAGMA